MTMLMLLPICHIHFDIMSITEGVVFSKEFRQKLRKDLNNQSPFKLHTTSISDDSKAVGNLIVRACM